MLDDRSFYGFSRKNPVVVNEIFQNMGDFHRQSYSSSEDL
ncbi:Uncharacterised protein [Chlamydia trachomatis]|nr:Uncharacterised protein [Chlamydia trachomatis]